MSAPMWFGTRGYESWIKMPLPDVEMPYVGHSQRSDHTNGGVTVTASEAGHREYSFEWHGRTNDTQPIADILDGQYDTDANQGLLYFIDPSSNTRNHLPKLWASPYLCGLDAPSLTKGLRPALSETVANSARLPARTATFTVGATTPLLTLYVPIPPGYEARWAFYGPTAQSSKIRVTPFTGATAGSPTDHDILANTDYGTGMATSSGVSGIQFSLKPNAGTVNLTAGILWIVPTGYIGVAPTSFFAGRGHSGCEVDGKVSHTIASANEEINWSMLQAHLVERGSWL